MSQILFTIDIGRLWRLGYWLFLPFLSVSLGYKYIYGKVIVVALDPNRDVVCSLCETSCKLGCMQSHIQKFACHNADCPLYLGSVKADPHKGIIRAWHNAPYPDDGDEAEIDANWVRDGGMLMETISLPEPTERLTGSRTNA